MYFYILLVTRFQFGFSGTVSAIWNWRSRAQDNTAMAVSQRQWDEAQVRIRRRLAQVTFPGGLLGHDVVGRGLAARSSVPGEFSIDNICMESEERIGIDDGALVRETPRQKERPLRWLHNVASWGHVLASGRLPKNAVKASELGLCFCIDFRAERLPYFIADEYGLAGRERWGRWTVGPKLRLRFRSSLPAALTLELCGYAFKSNDRKPITIRVGRSEARIAMTCRPSVYRVDINNVDRADTIVFSIPNPRAPSELYPGKSSDQRKLGIALTRLVVIDRHVD
jgi:phosphoglycerol transferase